MKNIFVKLDTFIMKYKLVFAIFSIFLILNGISSFISYHNCKLENGTLKKNDNTGKAFCDTVKSLAEEVNVSLAFSEDNNSFYYVEVE